MKVIDFIKTNKLLIIISILILLIVSIVVNPVVGILFAIIVPLLYKGYKKLSELNDVS